MVPVPLIRRNYIVNRLKACGAFSEQTAKTLDEAGVLNPNGYSQVTNMLVKKSILGKTKEQKYYLKSRN